MSQLQNVVQDLRNPAAALPRWAKVHSKQTGSQATYDPRAVTHRMQVDLVNYHAAPPRHPVTGKTLWMACLKSRQTGASTTCEYAAYPLASWSPGWDHVAIADTESRANYIHSRVQYVHRYWPEDARAPTESNNETRRLTFKHGGGMRVLSAHAGSVGIGESPNSAHLSEIGFWRDAATSMSGLLPALRTNDNALIVMECTPTSDTEPSTDYWKDHYTHCKLDKGGRWFSKFYPYWDGTLNAEPWVYGTPDLEEQRLLDRYGAAGLTLENLAFRRSALAEDVKLRRNPDLFAVWYPFDDRTCWVSTGGDFMRSDILTFRDHRLVEDNGEEYQEFEPPQPGCAYLVGADPKGWGTDHGAFVVMKVWADAGEEVVATYSTNKDPITYGDKLLEAAKRYNNALVVPERNGVGAGAITYLQTNEYPYVYLDENYKPGIHKSSNEQMLTVATEALMTSTTLRSGRLADQVISYRGDKSTQVSERTFILQQGKKDAKRREKHHWDLFSAYCVGLLGRAQVPQRMKHKAQVDDNVLPFSRMGYDAQQKFLKESAPRRSGGRFRPRRKR